MNSNFSCCGRRPKFLITFSVAGKEKDYLVCNKCEKLEAFSQFVIRKENIDGSKL